MKREKRRTIRNRILNVCGVICAVLLGVILIFNITLIAKGYDGSVRMPSISGYTPLLVQSGSMEPEIKTGDLIFIRESSADDLYAGETDGDIIAFWEGSSIVTHRAIDVFYEDGTRYITTKGDANNTPDSVPVAADQLIGTFSRRIPYLGDVIFFLQTTTGMLLVILVPVCIIFIQEGAKARRRHKKDREKLEVLERELERMQFNQKT